MKEPWGWGSARPGLPIGRHLLWIGEGYGDLALECSQFPRAVERRRRKYWDHGKERSPFFDRPARGDAIIKASVLICSSEARGTWLTVSLLGNVALQTFAVTNHSRMSHCFT